MSARPTTTTPSALSTAVLRGPVLNVGAPARARRAGEVPMAKVAMMTPADVGDPVEKA